MARTKLKEKENSMNSSLSSDIEDYKKQIIDLEISKKQEEDNSTKTGEAVVKMIENEKLLQNEIKLLKENLKSTEERADIAETAAASAIIGAGNGDSGEKLDVKGLMQEVFQVACEKFEGAENMNSKEIIKQMKAVLKTITASRS